MALCQNRWDRNAVGRGRRNRALSASLGRFIYTMTANSPHERRPDNAGADGSRTDKTSQPEWANGLRRLYDSVVEEDLPDSFKDLLSQLDSKD